MLLDNLDILGPLCTTPFKFEHFDMTYFTLYVNGRQIPSGGLHLDTEREKGTVMAYRTLFEGSGIRHSNSGLQVTHASFINGCFMFLFDLTRDQGALEGHSPIPTAVI